MAKKDAPAESEELEAAPKGISKLLKGFTGLFSRKDPNAWAEEEASSKSKSGKRGSKESEAEPEARPSGSSILTTVAALAGVLVLATLLIFFSISSYQLSSRIETMNDTILAVGKRMIELNQTIDQLELIAQTMASDEPQDGDASTEGAGKSILNTELKKQLDEQTLQLKDILDALAVSSPNNVGLDPATERQIKLLTRDLAALLELEKANYLEAMRNQATTQQAKPVEQIVTYPPAPPKKDD